MKIAIASDDGKNISAQFEKTTGFIMCQIDKDNAVIAREFVSNAPLNSIREKLTQAKNTPLESPGTLNHNLEFCDVVISRGIGFNSYTALVNSEIEVYLTKEFEADHAIKLYLNNQLDHNLEFKKVSKVV